MGVLKEILNATKITDITYAKHFTTLIDKNY